MPDISPDATYQQPLPICYNALANAADAMIGRTPKRTNALISVTPVVSAQSLSCVVFGLEGAIKERLQPQYSILKHHWR